MALGEERLMVSDWIVVMMLLFSAVKRMRCDASFSMRLELGDDGEKRRSQQLDVAADERVVTVQQRQQVVEEVGLDAVVVARLQRLEELQHA